VPARPALLAESDLLQTRKISFRTGFSGDRIPSCFKVLDLELNMTRSAHTCGVTRVVCIEDFRPIARERVPKSVFDYLDGGAEVRSRLRENCRILVMSRFRPRHAVCSRKLQICVREFWASTFLCVPACACRVQPSHASGGEVAAHEPLGGQGTGYILSTISGHKLGKT